MVLGHVVADPHALRTPLTAVHGDVGRPILIPLVLAGIVVIQNGIGFGAKLSAQLAAGCGTNVNANIGYEIH
jgi:hypothetical protein